MPTSFQTRYDQLTSRAHVYPPLELYSELSLRQVLDAWTRFAASSVQHKFGLYVHLPFCERKCSFCYLAIGGPIATHPSPEGPPMKYSTCVEPPRGPRGAPGKCRGSG